jgi:hypothetical protein
MTAERKTVYIDRQKSYPTPGRNYRFAWLWHYTVRSEGEWDAGASTLSEARDIAKRRGAEVVVVETWRGKGKR